MRIQWKPKAISRIEEKKPQAAQDNALDLPPICPPYHQFHLLGRVSGFEDWGLLPRMRLSHAVSLRRAGRLPAVPFRFHLAVDTLAVWPSGSGHQGPQGIRTPMSSLRQLEQHLSRRNAACQLHKKSPEKRGFIGIFYGFYFNKTLKGDPQKGMSSSGLKGGSS